MTKKDFVLIAEILRRADIENKYDKAYLIWTFATELEKQFPRFDRAEFISAASNLKNR